MGISELQMFDKKPANKTDCVNRNTAWLIVVQ